MLWSNSAFAAALRPMLIALALAAAPIDRLPARAADAGPPAAVQAASLAGELVAALDRVFQGPHPGERAIHTKGIVLRGTFTADPDAMSLSSAEHLRADGPPVSVIIRFSDFSGVPSQNDGKPGTSPAGMAIKFQLSGGVDTDIVAHSYNGFPVATPEDFLGYLNAVASSDPQVREAFFASLSSRETVCRCAEADTGQLWHRDLLRRRCLSLCQRGRGLALRPIPHRARRGRPISQRIGRRRYQAGLSAQ